MTIQRALLRGGSDLDGCLDTKLSDLIFAEDVVIMNENLDKSEGDLGNLNDSTATFGIHFAI